MEEWGWEWEIIAWAFVRWTDDVVSVIPSIGLYKREGIVMAWIIL